MKKKVNDLLLIGISVIVICMNNISLSRYENGMSCNVNSQIAKAIIEVKKDEKIEQLINQHTFPMEYHFWINNYKEDAVNEVDFAYTIGIESSVENFPISYVLIDCDNNREVSLINGKSEAIQMKKLTKESREFKLYLQWREIDGELADDLDIKLKVDAVQSRKGASYEDKANYGIGD